MTITKTRSKTEQTEKQKIKNPKGINKEKKEKQIRIREILDSDCPIPTYLKSDHGLVLKQIFSKIGNINDINSYINMRCSVAFPEQEKPKHGFDMVIDHEYFMGDFEKIKNKDKGEIKKIKERIVGFIKEILSGDNKHIFLLGPVNIDFLTEMASKFKLSDKSEEEIKEILSSKITHMQRETREKILLKIEAYKSINIHTGTNDNIKNTIQNKLLEIDCTKLEDANFVAAEFFENDNRVDTSKGIEKAFDIYTQSPDKKLILVSAIPFEEFKKNHENDRKLEFLLTQKNVRFLWLYDSVDFKKFKEETGFDFDADEETIKAIKPRSIKTFDPQILENLFEPDYLSTITFSMGGKPNEAINTMKETLKKINLKNLQNCIFIDLCAIYKEGDYLANLEGLTIAMEKLQKDPDKKIIITTPLGDIESLKAMADKAFKTDKLNFLLGRKNVKFFEYGDDIKKLETIFDEPENVTETNESILDTIQFYESRGWNPYLKDFFATLNLKKLNLKNSIVVDLRPDGGNSRDDMDGLKIASETLQQYPDTKIILCSLIPTDILQNVIKGKKPEKYLETLLQGKNVRLIQSSGGNSMTQEEVLKQFDGMYLDTQTSPINDGGKTFQQLAEIEGEVAFQKLMEGEISHFLHDAGHRAGDELFRDKTNEEKLKYLFFDHQDKHDKRLNFENRMIALLQIQHPSFKLLPKENNLQWIIDMYTYSRTQGLPEGTKFEGVFVDRDGCLYDNKKLKFNQKIIDMIKDYESQGKKIIIRSGGNLEMKQKLLDNEPQLKHLRIKSKTDYKGGTVEIAIDNDSPEMLLANARIKAEQHIKV